MNRALNSDWSSSSAEGFTGPLLVEENTMNQAPLDPFRHPGGRSRLVGDCPAGHVRPEAQLRLTGLYHEFSRMFKSFVRRFGKYFSRPGTGPPFPEVRTRGGPSQNPAGVLMKGCRPPSVRGVRASGDFEGGDGEAVEVQRIRSMPGGVDLDRHGRGIPGADIDLDGTLKPGLRCGA